MSAETVAEDALTSPKTARKHLNALADEGFVVTANGEHGETIYRRSPESLVVEQPDTILEREDEIEEYKHALSDAVFGRSPDNVFIYGKAGVGKTAVTIYVLNELEAEVQKRDAADPIHISRVNCNNESVYSITRSLINNLRADDTDRFPAKGPSKADAFERLYDEMDRLGGTHFFVFDEIDHVTDPDSLLYEFPRARANGYLENARVGIIGISNNYTFRNTLSPKVKDTLMEQEIAFSTYDAGELATISSIALTTRSSTTRATRAPSKHARRSPQKTTGAPAKPSTSCSGQATPPRKPATPSSPTATSRPSATTSPAANSTIRSPTKPSTASSSSKHSPATKANTTHRV